ncbi:MAG: DUF362 domain-containing protein [Acidobacteria bacterium]|nr:DUF362 domain-containing protein [Acidobacteriota bacterium]
MKSMRLAHLGLMRWRSLSLAVVGFLSLLWFLVRVLPKPSRAAYPCQRAAAPLASGFVIWMLGLIGSAAVYRWALGSVARSRRVLGLACLVLVPLIGLSGFLVRPNAGVTAWTPSEGPNDPIGIARGIFPGRVVWVRSAKAVKWDGSTGNWYDDARGDQKAIAKMMSRSVRWLTGASTDEAAWTAIFKYNNTARGRGNAGYRKGETIAIKPNLVSCFRYDHGGATESTVDNDAHLVYALVDQLVNKAGVPAGKIWIYTAPSLLSPGLGDQVVPDYIYKKIRSNPDFRRVRFYDTVGASGRLRAAVSTHRITWGAPGADTFEPDYIADVPANATYLINFAVLKSHANNALSLCGKNHGGSFCRSFGALNSPGRNFLDLHQYMNSGSVGGDTPRNYRPFVDLMGHRDLGGKTILYLIDGLWGGNLPSGWNGVPERWNSCGISNDWPKSLFASLDPVAIDSVGLDFCYEQYSVTQSFQFGDDYLHEAALANAPPSGSFYAPNADGIQLGSLGVHEHWNNPIEKRYTRNLSPAGTGIELVSSGPR